ncbi:unnamed protein product [Gadus morhua 'NCC']
MHSLSLPESGIHPWGVAESLHACLQHHQQQHKCRTSSATKPITIQPRSLHNRTFRGAKGIHLIQLPPSLTENRLTAGFL